MRYLPQDVHKTQGIRKLNTTTCSLPDTDSSAEPRHQAPQNEQALKRKNRKLQMTGLQLTYLKAKEHRVEQTMWSLVFFEAIYSFKCAICLQTWVPSSMSGTHAEDLATGNLPGCLKEMDAEEKSLPSAKKIPVLQSLTSLIYMFLCIYAKTPTAKKTMPTKCRIKLNM